MSFLKNGTTYSATHDSRKGARSHKTGPGRGRRHPTKESIEDNPPRLTNPAVLESRRRADCAVEEHPMSRRLEQRRMKHLRSNYKRAVGPEFDKVMGSMHPGRHRVGKVRSM